MLLPKTILTKSMDHVSLLILALFGAGGGCVGGWGSGSTTQRVFYLQPFLG